MTSIRWGMALPLLVVALVSCTKTEFTYEVTSKDSKKASKLTYYKGTGTGQELVEKEDVDLPFRKTVKLGGHNCVPNVTAQVDGSATCRILKDGKVLKEDTDSYCVVNFICAKP